MEEESLETMDDIDPTWFDKYLQTVPSSTASPDVPQFYILDDDLDLENQSMDKTSCRPTTTPDVPLSFADIDELNKYVDGLLSSFNFPLSSDDAVVDIASPSASSIAPQENVELLDFSATKDLASHLAAAELTNLPAIEMATCYPNASKNSLIIEEISECSSSINRLDVDSSNGMIRMSTHIV